MQRWRTPLFYLIVRWEAPTEGWLKCNTDGASKSNPHTSAYDLYIRDGNGDLKYAEAKSIGVTTNSC